MNPETARRPVLLLVLTCTLSLTSCRTPPPEWLLQPVEADRQLGAKVSRQVKEQIGIVDDPELTSYLNAVGQRLTSQISGLITDSRSWINRNPTPLRHQEDMSTFRADCCHWPTPRMSRLGPPTAGSLVS